MMMLMMLECFAVEITSYDDVIVSVNCSRQMKTHFPIIDCSICYSGCCVALFSVVKCCDEIMLGSINHFMSCMSVSYSKKVRSLYKRKPSTLVVTAFKNGGRERSARVAAPTLRLVMYHHQMCCYAHH